jgi:hypothetical protein
LVFFYTGISQGYKPVFAEPHHFFGPGKNCDAAPAPTLLYSKAKFLKRIKV